MRRKNILGMSLVLMIIFGVFTIIPVFASPGTIYIDPASISWDTTTAPGDRRFDLEVRVADLTDCFGIIFSIDWNASIIQAVWSAPGDEAAWAGDALSGATAFLVAAVDNTAGYIKEATLMKLGGTGDDITDGLVATIPFEVVQEPVLGGDIDTTIDFVDNAMVTLWMNTDGDEFRFDAMDGFTFHYEVVTAAPYAPTAKFSIIPPYAYINDTVTFDASASKSGFDGDSACPITEYRWNFGDGDDLIVGYPVTQHIYTEEGTFPVTLEVYAPGIPPVDPGYVETDTESKSISVLPPVEGLAIDLYSEAPDPCSGKGPNVPSDAFEPQEEICFFVDVTYNGEPVLSKMVVFEISGPPNAYYNFTIYRTAETDAYGVATMCFRVPWPGLYPKEAIFGDWTAHAVVEVAEMIAEDTMPFEIGWLVEIIDMETGIQNNGNWIPQGSFKKGECIGVKFTIKNIGCQDKVVDLSIVVYDELGVPVVFYTIKSYTIYAEPKEKNLEFYCYLDIPQWAFVGVGTVYANTFKPAGIPYSPEASTVVTITA